MKALPFLMAPSATYTFDTPLLRLNDRVFEPGQPVVGWDYLAHVDIGVELEYDQEAICATTSITELEAIAAFMQIDCLATVWRALTAVPLSRTSNSLSLSLSIPPGTVAQELEVRAGLVLSRDNPARSSELAATLRGSRLSEAVAPSLFVLEGDGSTFPVEAFNFGPTGLPANAPWHLHFNATSLSDPFRRSVRLNVNTSHPKADDILAGASDLISSVVQHGVALDLLLASAPLLTDDIEAQMPEGSVGEVADGMCRALLGLSIAEFAYELRNEPSEIMTRLRASTGILTGGAQ